MTAFLKCEFCGNDVHPDHACHPVSGWEQRRAGAGGANQILGRKRDDSTAAHRHCVDLAVSKARRGISEDQDALDV